MGARKRKADSKPRSIVDELRQAMLDSGLTKYRIAEDSGVPHPVVIRFLNGTRGLSFETAGKLCDYLRLHLVSREE
jgi:hypothetical protein